MARPKNNYKSKTLSVPVALIPKFKHLIAEWQAENEKEQAFNVFSQYAMDLLLNTFDFNKQDADDVINGFKGEPFDDIYGEIGLSGITLAETKDILDEEFSNWQ